MACREDFRRVSNGGRLGMIVASMAAPMPRQGRDFGSGRQPRLGISVFAPYILFPCQRNSADIMVPASWGKTQMALTIQKLEALWGKSAEEVSNDLGRFSQSARALSNEHACLIEKHPQEWVGVHDGEVVATGKTMKTVLHALDKQGRPNDETIVRFISRDPVTLIL